MLLVQGLVWTGCIAAVLWISGALYFDVAHRAAWGRTLALLWVALAALILTRVQPVWLAEVIILVILAGVLIWWFSQTPSHDRDWDPNFSKLPRLTIQGDALTAINVRNTRYRSLNDYDCHYETRTYLLSDLKAVDVLILYWGSRWMCHPMAIFDFGNDQHLCFSIEVRYRRGEAYDILRSLYRQNEIMMVVCDERDAILRRTKFSVGHECYLYRMQKDPEFARELLDAYISATNSVYDQPRWYNAVTWNCTTTIYWMRRGQIPWDWRWLFNGSLDQMLYDWGRLYQGIPFDELKCQSLINEAANHAAAADFSREIRRGLPGFDVLNQR